MRILCYLPAVFAFDSALDTAQKKAGMRCVSKAFPVDNVHKTLAGPSIAYISKKLVELQQDHGFRQMRNVRESLSVKQYWINLQLQRVLQTTSTTQIVILGAGFDTRAYYLPDLQGKHVFEVDLYEIVNLKNEIIGRNNFSSFCNVTRIAHDLNEYGVMHKLTEHGYDPEQQTVFIAEGIQACLSHELHKTLLRLPLSNTGNTLIMDITSKNLKSDNCESMQSIGNGMNDPLKQLRRMGYTDIVIDQVGSETANFGALDTEIPHFLTNHWGCKIPLRITEVDGVPIQRLFLIKAVSI